MKVDPASDHWHRATVLTVGEVGMTVRLPSTSTNPAPWKVELSSRLWRWPAPAYQPEGDDPE